MLSVLRSQLKEGERLVEFEYRNLLPLYTEEKMKVCIRRDPEKEDKIDVWIEEPGGGYAVRGTALIDKDYLLETKHLILDTPHDLWSRNESANSKGQRMDPEEKDQANQDLSFKIRRRFST